MQIKQTAQQIATNVAKQTIHESNEFLKSAGEQIAGSHDNPKDKSEPAANTSPSADVKPKNLSFLNDYKQELEGIRRENLFKTLMLKISQGETIPLEEYVNELSYEQREVLKAQMEAVKIRMENQKSQAKNSLPDVISKKGRAMFNKIKGRNEKHVETRQPPSS